MSEKKNRIEPKSNQEIRNLFNNTDENRQNITAPLVHQPVYEPTAFKPRGTYQPDTENIFKGQGLESTSNLEKH